MESSTSLHLSEKIQDMYPSVSEEEVEEHQGRHQCSVCNRVFISTVYLQRHMASHKGQSASHAGLPELSSQSEGGGSDTSSSQAKSTSHARPLESSMKMSELESDSPVSPNTHVILLTDRQSRHHCTLCSRTFVRLYNLENHMIISHTGHKPYMRQLSAEALKELGRLRHDVDKQHQCWRCPANFSWATDLVEHIKSAHAEKSLTCVNCLEKFSDIGALTSHLLSHPQCRDGMALKDHVSTGSQMAMAREAADGATPVPNLKNDSGMVIMESCDEQKQKEFEAPALKRSKRSDGKARKGVSNDGKQSAPKATHCNVDTNLNSGKNCGGGIGVKGAQKALRKKRHFQCEVCSKTFRKTSDLKRHQMIHSGDRPWPCPCCPARFARADNLKSHMVKHSRDKPFQCQECSALFGHASSLIQHVRTQHSDQEKFACNVCDISFSRRRDLRRHWLTIRHMQIFNGRKHQIRQNRDMESEATNCEAVDPDASNINSDRQITHMEPDGQSGQEGSSCCEDSQDGAENSDNSCWPDESHRRDASLMQQHVELQSMEETTANADVDSFEQLQYYVQQVLKQKPYNDKRPKKTSEKNTARPERKSKMNKNEAEEETVEYGRMANADTLTIEMSYKEEKTSRTNKSAQKVNYNQGISSRTVRTEKKVGVKQRRGAHPKRFYCDICKTGMTRRRDLLRHFDSARHVEQERKSKSKNPVQADVKSWLQSDVGDDCKEVESEHLSQSHPGSMELCGHQFTVEHSQDRLDGSQFTVSGNFCCKKCGGSFERPDHLAAHLCLANIKEEAQFDGDASGSGSTFKSSGSHCTSPAQETERPEHS